MELIVPLKTQPQRLAVLPATFNPPTLAHVALAEASLQHADAALMVLPRVLPHKEYAGVTFDDRLEMLRRLARARPTFAAAVSEGGLFIDIAQEVQTQFPGAKLFVVCGRDAAERIINWDYGDHSTLEHMLEMFQLLVAPRCGVYTPPAHLQHAVRSLDVRGYDDCSSTEVRSRISANTPWTHLVPEDLVEVIRSLYS
jgi:nicotinate (nicotinamide) nucleotide adenylyltransferase